MADNSNLEAVMSLIVNAGNAKSDAMEALQAAKKGLFDEAEEKIRSAESSLKGAHKAQTSMLTEEAKGENMTINLLTIHGQDHLMTAINFIDLAKEMIDMYKLILIND